MIITTIEEQKKNRDRVSVFLNGVFAFGIHFDLLADFKLKVGMELSEDFIAEIKTADAFRQAYDKAIGFLARRPRSQHEMRQYLRDKLVYHHPDYAEQVANSDTKDAFIAQQTSNIERIIQKLQDLGYVDDVAFAKWWIDNRRQFKPRGKRLLLLELQAKGVSVSDLETALTTPSEEGHFHSQLGEEAYDERNAAATLAQKYLKKYAHLSDHEQQQKLSRYLASKGYGWETVSDVWRQLKEQSAD